MVACRTGAGQLGAAAAVVGLELEPAHDVEAEQTVVGAAMFNTAAYEGLRQMVVGEAFYRPAHQLVWETIGVLYEAGKAIDPMGVMLELRETGQIAKIGNATYLHDLYSKGASPNAAWCAHRVSEMHRARRIQQTVTRLAQVAEESLSDHDAFLSGIAREAINLEILVDERTLDEPIEGLIHWSETWARYPSETVEWLIPGLLVAEDVWMLLGGEGGGKSYLTRQFCLCLAAGVHPFHPSKRIRPLRTLLLDGENAPSMVAYESRLIGHQVSRLGDYDDDLAFLVHRQDGMNLRDRKAALELERMVAQSGAEVVVLGPLYKLFKRGRDDWEHAAEDVQNVIDRIRRRYGCAVVIEHHMPKAGSGGERQLNPYGSSTWMRWPSLGHVVHRVGDNMWELIAFRGNRLVREMPRGLTRRGALPWMPVWTGADVDAMRWTAKTTRRASAPADHWEAT